MELTESCCPCCQMSIVEYFNCKHCHRQKTMQACGLKIHPWFWAIYQMVGVFAFGAACSQLATDIGEEPLSTHPGLLGTSVLEMMYGLICTFPINGVRHLHVLSLPY